MHFIGVANEERAPLLIELGARTVVPDFVDLPRFMNALEIDFSSDRGLEGRCG